MAGGGLPIPELDAMPEHEKMLFALRHELMPAIADDVERIVKGLASERDALVAECRRLRDALGFYADPATYLAHGPLPPSQSSFEDPAVDLDRGRRARAALEGGAS